MSRTSLKPLYPLIGTSHDKWDEFLQTIEPSREDQEAKQAILAEWHAALVQTAKEIEWAYSALETLKTKEAAAALATERKRRRMEDRLSLREFLSLPASSSDEPLRKLRLISRSGAEMRLEVLSFAGSENANVTTVNRARALFKRARYLRHSGAFTTSGMASGQLVTVGTSRSWMKSMSSFIVKLLRLKDLLPDAP